MFILLLSFADEINSPEQGGLFDFNATLPLMMLQFLFLVFLLNSFFYKPVTDILDERADYIRNSLTSASAYLVQANELTEQYEKALAESRKLAQNIIKSSQKEAQDVVTINIKQAQQEAENLVYEASEQLNIQKKEALKSLENQINILSDQIQSKLFSKQFL